MRVDLPVLASEPACPAALKIAGACRSQQGVVCRVMQSDQEEDPGLAMSAGDLGVLREAEGGVYLNLKSDPSTVTGFCHGDAVPVLTDDEGQGRASYTYCSTWQEHRDRHREGKAGLTDPVVPEPVSMGVEPYASHMASDPWAAGRVGLDELAPVSDEVPAGWAR